MPTQMYLIRHGATAANLACPPRLQGCRSDPPLNELGRWQAEATRDEFQGQPLAACYCSPLRRAAETAEILCAGRGLVPAPLAELTECDVGAWEGLSWDTIRSTYPESFQRFSEDPGRFPYLDGESHQDVRARVEPVLGHLLASHDGTAFVVVTHQVVIRVYLAALLGVRLAAARSIQTTNCGITELVADAAGVRVRVRDATAHLDRLAKPEGRS